MTDEEKKNAVDAEASATEVKEEKKGNIFSRAWNKTKTAVNDSLLEAKIQTSYKNDHKAYSYYQKDSIMSPTYYGGMVDGKLELFGTPELKAGNIIMGDEENDPAYFIVSTEKTICRAVVDGVEYERDGILVTLDGDITEVNVIKCGKRYFLVK